MGAGGGVVPAVLQREGGDSSVPQPQGTGVRRGGPQVTHSQVKSLKTTDLSM